MTGIVLAIIGFGVLAAIVWWLVVPDSKDVDPAVDSPSCCNSISGDGSDNDTCCRSNKPKSYKLDQSKSSCCRSTPVNTFDDVDLITPVIVNNMMNQSSYPNRDVDISSVVSSTYTPTPTAEVTKDSDFSSMNTAPSTPSYDSSSSYSSPSYDSSSSSYDSGSSCDSGSCGCGGD